MLLTVLWLLLYFSSLINHLQAVVVDTNYGKVNGFTTEKAKVFRSIPYAQPPVKDLRWKDPLPPHAWTGILQATEDPPACPQNPKCLLPNGACPKRIQEDCLYLNVFTPLTATTSSQLPVMVFMHGGSFVSGYCGGLIYDGQYIVNRTEIILVTINYRLGALGFLVYGKNLEIGGNYGFKDQRFALKWIQENIANFGGDPNSVTIFGQSAGAVSVASHMCSVESSGLFHRAIIQSFPMGVALKGKSDSLSLGRRFSKQVGCGDDSAASLACMRAKDIDSIIAAQRKVDKDIIDYDHIFDIFLQWTPYMDGIEISDQPIKAFEEGRVASVPVIMGNVEEETYSYVMAAFVKPITNKYYYALLQTAVYGVENYQEVAKLYPFNNGSDNRMEVVTMATDNPFYCPTRCAAGGLANSTGFPVWVYNFDHVASFNPWPPNLKSCSSHVCHGEELAFLFHTAPLGGYKYTADEEKLSNQMITYWTNLAKYGDPNGKGVVSWPQYTYAAETVLRFMTPNSKLDSYRSEYCDTWDQIGYNV